MHRNPESQVCWVPVAHEGGNVCESAKVLRFLKGFRAASASFGLLLKTVLANLFHPA